jgi:parvulin-like peptidyl-prolyl isomerase
VTAAELEQAYESEYGEMVQVRMIMCSTRPKAEQIRSRATAQPDSFDRLAKDHSEDENSAAARGLIPPVRRHVGEPAVEKAVFSLTEGQVSPVVEVAGQFYGNHRFSATPVSGQDRQRDQ